MSSDSSLPAARFSLIETLYTIFMRMVAGICFYFAIHYWNLVIGLTSDSAIRFDLMALPWRTMATIFAVLYPIVSLGLWMGVSWGVVLWLAAAGAEIAMHTVWVRLYGPDRLLVFLHLSVALVYAVFQLALYLDRRKARREVTSDLL